MSKTEMVLALVVCLAVITFPFVLIANHGSSEEKLESTYWQLQSMIGQKITTIECSDRRFIVRTDGGGEVVVESRKYSQEVAVTKPR